MNNTKYVFTGSEFHPLYQPSLCFKRVWLAENQPELAADDSAFQDLVLRRGKAIEARHLEELAPYHKPVYPEDDLAAGAEATRALIKCQAPIIYQPIFISPAGFLGIPNLLIFDTDSEKYIVRDVKLATNIYEHPEISLQMGLYQMVASHTLGYKPQLELVTGDGQIQAFQAADGEQTLAEIDSILQLRKQTQAPLEPVGWSKCGPCVFKNVCWDTALEKQDIAAVPYVDQGICRALYGLGIVNYTQLSTLGENALADIKRPWGKQMRRVGLAAARKIKLQIKALLSNEQIVATPPSLPPGYQPGTRPVVMFDIENDVFDLDLGVKVYLWGCLLVEDTPTSPQLIVAGEGIDGDKQGWHDFLSYVNDIFHCYGDIPFVHYSPHERTWIKNYIKRYGDVEDTANRLLDNLWDMYPAIEKNLFLPIPSYGLKFVEELVGFQRSQEEFGGLWSIITYDQYINAASKKEADTILKEILTYNSEDLLATLAVYQWLENIVSAGAVGRLSIHVHS